VADSWPADELTDDVLAAALTGDEAAFAVVYRVLQPRLRRYATALVGQEADDVTAEAWLQIARDLRRFRGDADAFRGWTTRIVRNRALDASRARGRRRTDPTDATEILDAVATDDPAADALQRLSTSDAIALIASLPREQAEAVLLRAVVGLDGKTAGEVLGKSATAVRVAAHRGLRTLARRLAQDPRNPAKRKSGEGR
jgi:RNA polymerase sigma-70 factor (ECF subfamily)